MTTAAATSLSSATASVTPTGAGHRLALSGRFDHPHWLAFLCAGLAHTDVSVLSGRAHRDADGIWQAGFELRGWKASRAVDPVLLASTRPAKRDPNPPAITSYQLTRRTDGSLDLHLTAPDQTGFLGRLLSRVSLLTLLPVDLDIRTIGSTIEDHFVFAGMRGSSPDRELHEALDSMLRGFVRP